MSLIKKNASPIWHPFRQEMNSLPLLSIVKAKGSTLYAEDGREYLDMVSSWWVNTHGHAHPKIAKAISDQAHTLEQVLFADIIHPSAEQLAKKLRQLLPSHLIRLFYSDNGSTAVEVSLKMAYQYWYNKGQPERCRFIAFEGSYHGDTFGAMAVGRSSGFHKPFEKFLFHVDIMSFPDTWMDDAQISEKEDKVFSQLESYLEKFSQETAALIIEPLIQGASGMRFCRPAFLQKLVNKMRDHGILVIFDEVMTGFGRTGSLFACQKANVGPDIICLAKGLTGGFLPLAVTAASEEIYQAFLGETFEKAFAHGHSFAANALGCAAALANLSIFEEEKTIEKIQEIEKIHFEYIDLIKKHHLVTQPRVMGSIAAFNINYKQRGYNSPVSLILKKAFFERGIFLRPLGNVIYLMPPYCITKEELKYTYKNIIKILDVAL